MSSEPLRQLTSKVLTTSYEPDRIHSAAVRHTLGAIQDDPEIQAEFESRGLRLLVPGTSPDAFVNGNRQGIYILLREVIQNAARSATAGTELIVTTRLTAGGLCLSLSYRAEPEDAMQLLPQESPALNKIIADMRCELQQSRDHASDCVVTEVTLALV